MSHAIPQSILASPSAPRRITARLVDRLDRLPPRAWPLLVLAATWPSLFWTARRSIDGSDDPLGIVAIAALMLALWHARARFDRAPRIALLAMSSVLVIASNAPWPVLPDLVRALLAGGALVAALAAIADREQPVAPLAGFAVLALPLLSSLQFYAGFPLRIVTAEASGRLLALFGSAVERTGTALLVDGRLVLVDAPCSGVQMAWVGYFTACAVAVLFRLSNRAFLMRLPVVGVAVLVGNILRNTLLVAAEAHRVAMTDAMHAAVGLFAFTMVCGAIGVISWRGRGSIVHPVRIHDGRPRRTPLLPIVLLAVGALLPCSVVGDTAEVVSQRREMPREIDGMPLVPLALSSVEARFSEGFPGTIGRFASGSRTVVLREIDRPTRRLHPAADCYRGLGYSIADERLERDREARLWRCFRATDGTSLRVCERIVDRDGQAFTDTSSWFWAASLGRSNGPWRAITVAHFTGASS